MAIGKSAPQPQILSIMPFKQPLLQTQRSKRIMSMYKQQLSLLKPKQFNIIFFSL